MKTWVQLRVVHFIFKNIFLIIEHKKESMFFQLSRHFTVIKNLTNQLSFSPKIYILPNIFCSALSAPRNRNLPAICEAYTLVSSAQGNPLDTVDSRRTRCKRVVVHEMGGKGVFQRGDDGLDTPLRHTLPKRRRPLDNYLSVCLPAVWLLVHLPIG